MPEWLTLKYAAPYLAAVFLLSCILHLAPWPTQLHGSTSAATQTLQTPKMVLPNITDNLPPNIKPLTENLLLLIFVWVCYAVPVCNALIIVFRTRTLLPALYEIWDCYRRILKFAMFIAPMVICFVHKSDFEAGTPIHNILSLFAVMWTGLYLIDQYMFWIGRHIHSRKPTLAFQIILAVACNYFSEVSFTELKAIISASPVAVAKWCCVQFIQYVQDVVSFFYATTIYCWHFKGTLLAHLPTQAVQVITKIYNGSSLYNVSVAKT